MPFIIRYRGSSVHGPFDGRLFLLLSNDGRQEPRFQISEDLNTQLVFGIDVENWLPGQPLVLDARADGYPIPRLDQVPAGIYYAQAVLHLYETFHRADGHIVKLPMDRGEGQKWNEAPGNLYCTPQQVHWDPADRIGIPLTLDQVIPPLPLPEDTHYVRHLRLQSPRLSAFWGRPMYLEATVLLPHGYETHPQARYPVMIYHGHHHRTFATPVGFRETPPDDDPNLNEEEQLYQAYSYRLFRDWTSPDFPRCLVVTIQHANPYYDDSYAVNSANMGPYGDAITYELIPYIEEQLRGLGAPWARTLYGGSTGGWAALAAQIFYPDEYNGVWSCCPDPVDFSALGTVNIYQHRNAYYQEGPWRRTPRPCKRNALGELLLTVAEANQMELALGSRGRSGGQYDAWQAVYSPVGDDGYPRPIWDKRTGEIDPEVAAYWREHYDLRHILERDWPRIGRKLVGKLHIYIGDMDSYYLNNAVRRLEEFLEQTDPYYAGEVRYGHGFEHCWSGDPDAPIKISRLTYSQRFIPKMIDHILATAPDGADVQSWRY